MNRKLCLLVLMTIVLSACTADSPERSQVKGVIMRYNALLAEGYRKMNMNPLQQVATESVATKAYYHMAALGEGKVRMESSLREMQFKEVEFPTRDTAKVTTRETWDFTHNDLATGRKVLEEKGFPYEIIYELKQEGSQWKVSNVLAMGEEHPDALRAARPAARTDAVPEHATTVSGNTTATAHKRNQQ